MLAMVSEPGQHGCHLKRTLPSNISLGRLHNHTERQLANGPSSCAPVCAEG